MKHHKTLLLTAFITPLLAGCGADSHTVQNGNSKYQLSVQKGKDKMPTESPMLNEIFASIGNRIISPGQSQDVSHIVSEYIPIGTSKEQARQILNTMNQKYKEEGNIIHAGYGIPTHPLVPSPGVRITLQFNQYHFLEKIEAEFSHAQ